MDADFLDGNDRLYKILVVGDVATGKTSVIKRYVHNVFSQHYKSTIGVDFALKVLKLNPNMEVRLQLWDIAGQERFGSMTHVYYREAVAAFVVFDIARQSTFDSLAEWKADIDAKVTYGPENKLIPVVLLANKCDLPRDTFCKTTEEIELFAKEHGFIAWFETSAKNDIGIEKAAEFLVGYILAHDASFRTEKDNHIITNDDLGKAMTVNTSGVGCC